MKKKGKTKRAARRRPVASEGLSKERKKYLDSLSMQNLELGLSSGELDEADREYVLGL